MTTHQTSQTEPTELAALLGPFWSASRTRRALGLATPAALDAMTRDGAVLALPMRDSAVLYPVFQFQRTGDQVVVRPALVPVLRALRSFDPWTVAVLLLTPAPELGDKTPLSVAQSGERSPELAALARTIAGSSQLRV